MAWCPNCKNEYREGITVCADCGATLVESLTEQTVVPILTIEQEAAATRLKEFMEYEGISLVVCEELTPGSYQLSVPEEEKKEALRLVQIFTKVEQEKQLAALSPEELATLQQEAAEKEEASRNSHTYVNAKDKYTEHKSSGQMFLVVGAIGIIFLLLNILGVLHILSGWFSLGIAAIMFIAFFFIGISSLRRASELKGEISKESDQIAEINEWMKNHLTEEFLAEACDPEAGEEENDIFRFDYAKKALLEAYPDLDESFADHLVDEFLQ